MRFENLGFEKFSNFSEFDNIGIAKLGLMVKDLTLTLLKGNPNTTNGKFNTF